MGALFSSFSSKKKNKESKAKKEVKIEVNTRKNSSDEITEKDRAILDLKNVRDKLRRFRGRLETESKKLELNAKELIKMRQKNRALLCLKLKRFKEKELDGIDVKLMNIMTLIQDVEWASINLSVFSAIEAGTKELNRIHEERTLEDVEALLEESNEAIEVENEINRVLAGQLTVADDAELELELDLIVRELFPKVIVQPAAVEKSEEIEKVEEAEKEIQNEKENVEENEGEIEEKEIINEIEDTETASTPAVATSKAAKVEEIQTVFPEVPTSPVKIPESKKTGEQKKILTPA